ncbi:facilitated trehalose transporter Tret1-like [Hyalella azteca]|uniref:Facilitated trehalose transporter Tret1-like n=1 Tax=Hyalella azteca TaxID=294128 RepID=A0A8B7PQH9_HYAAZ|nr:facilitated trehalose transporter Tret1-like [Hyalella azteca]
MAEGSSPASKPAYLTQYFAALSVSVSSIAVGAVLGFNSPASFQLRAAHDVITANPTKVFVHDRVTHYNDSNGHLSYENDGVHYNFTSGNFSYRGNTTNLLGSKIMTDTDMFDGRKTFKGEPLLEAGASPMVMTSEELSWFMSVFALGALVGGLLSGLLINAMGRRGALLVSAVPSLLGWLMTGLGTNLPTLVLGRALSGVYIGLSSAAGNAYVGEIASSNIRGILGSFYELSLALGILLVMLVGAFTTWQNLALICTSPTLVYAVLIFFCRESPAYLLMKGREAEARAALQHFRGACIVNVGIEVLTSNLSSIFKNSGSEMSEDLSSILCIVVEILAGIAAVFLVEKAGRKCLLVSSSAVLAASHCSLGLFFYMLTVDEQWTRKFLFWLPLTALMTYVIAFGIGLGAVIWILMGEMLPPLVRETAAGLTVAGMWAASFITVHSYEFLQSELRGYGFHWLYCGICVLGTVFSATVVKETKGITLEEITKLFMKKEPLDETRGSPE